MSARDVRLSHRLRNARHELRCWECRVTWSSWLARLLGTGGYEPRVRGGR